MERIDVYPTHLYQGYGLRPGRPYPFGATDVPNGTNFSVFSKHADYCVLVLFEKGASEPLIEIPFRGLFEKPGTKELAWGDFRVGNVFCMVVFNLDHENIEYGFRMDGPFDKVDKGQPGIHRFDRRNILLDPYARGIGGREVWGETPDWDDVYHHRARLVMDDFDWESDRPLEIPLEDLVIYEMHVRSFTRHPTSGARHPGTFAGIREKLPYLKDLGINCVELMPIYEFDEFENSKPNPVTGELLLNYWGYSTVGFFSPKAGYAATGKSGDATMVADELKTLIKDCHQSGIEVMLDVVFNHTAEGNEYGPVISFRGIDNATYYMLTPEGYYYNFSGTGNTLNCNNPIVRNIVLDCLRYWVAEYHVDGFRFDLASILGRDPWGAPLANPPLLEALANDPVLAKVKLIAEAWDAGGLYQVGSFPAYGRWAEWNGKYRDDIRNYLKGDEGLIGAISQRIQGSPDLYTGRGPTASINFITCHDGFTLMDNFSYNEKHNEANGEGNSDGANDNNSWNSGWEGPTDDPAINEMRLRQVKNALTIMMVSQGVPMILMGDEVGRTKLGNNNTYCHDNELNWFDWNLLEQNGELLKYFKHMIAFRHAHPVLRGRNHLRNDDYVGSGYADISWHGTRAWNADWSNQSRVLAFMLCGKHAKEGQEADDYIYVALNSHWDGYELELPQPPDGLQWHVFANTAAAVPDDIWEIGQEPLLENQQSIWLGARSALVLVGR
jgi:glycogen operon protein